MKNYTLHLIRHGLTQGNIDGLFIGSGTDVSVREEGIERLKKLKESFDYPKVEKLYVSPMKRCMETARILFPDMDYSIVTDLREINFGVLEGKSFREMLKEDPDFIKFMDPNENYTPEGGESGQRLGIRAISALNEILEDMMKNGIHEARAVTHGMLMAILLTIVGYPRKDTMEWTSDNGCGFTVTTTPAMWMRDGAVEVVDIVPHGYLDSGSEDR
ncbi:MAG: histidine phosphatase family protein [Oscillospiraceae bacterium]|nr:histidine phosphatase family protein [Oscillospiraceae bacterium]